MSYKLPIHLLGLAAALIAGVVFVAPAQAQKHRRRQHIFDEPQHQR